MHAAVDSGCNENVQLMCERPNYGLSWLQRKSWHCGDARVMDVLLGLMHCWRWSGEPYIPVCPSVGRNLSELSAGDLPQADFWIISQNREHAVPGNISKAQGMAAHSLCVLRNRGASYCDLRFIGLPIATRKMAALPVACGEKKLITSSSKKVSPVAPKPWAYADRYILPPMAPASNWTAR